MNVTETLIKHSTNFREKFREQSVVQKERLLYILKQTMNIEKIKKIIVIMLILMGVKNTVFILFNVFNLFVKCFYSFVNYMLTKKNTNESQERKDDVIIKYFITFDEKFKVINDKIDKLSDEQKEMSTRIRSTESSFENQQCEINNIKHNVEYGVVGTDYFSPFKTL